MNFVGYYIAVDQRHSERIISAQYLSFISLQFDVVRVGKRYIVDAIAEEESQMSSAISISVNQQGHICVLTKRGGVGLDPTMIHDMISVAKHVSEQFLNKLDSEIATAQARKEES
ncbi:uncharacterized protein LOC141612820 [Silene latifolia]|uniref:uncharacterized protein LOC141612820 n=1 Tax=Silene latifolia TaxID=37657 RepID=UPI003D7794AD